MRFSLKTLLGVYLFATFGSLFAVHTMAHPGPLNPNLTPRFKLHNSEEFLLSRPLGTAVHTGGNAHLRFEINVTRVRTQLEGLRNMTLAALNNAKRDMAIYALPMNSHPGSQPRPGTVPAFSHDMALATIRYENVLLMLDRIDHVMNLARSAGGNRDKRFVAEFIAGATAVWTIYNTIELTRLAPLVDNNQKAITAIIHRIDDFDQAFATQSRAINDLQSLAEDLAVNQAELATTLSRSEMYDALTMTLNLETTNIQMAVQALMNHRMPVGILLPTELAEALEALAHQAALHDYVLLANTESDVLQCETSFVTHEHGLTVIVHVPMAKSGDLLTVYQHVPLPYGVQDDLYLTIKPEQDIIAISDDRKTFRTMTSEDLSRCRQLGRQFICDHGNLARMVGGQEEDSCVYHLFMKNFDQIKKTCPVHLVGPTEGAIAISGTEFIILSPKPTIGTINCHGFELDQFQVNRITRITLEPGCTAYTDEFSATSSFDVETIVPTRSFAWNADVKELLDNLDVEKYIRLASRASNQTKVPTAVQHAKEWMAAVEDFEEGKSTRTGLWGLGIGILAGTTIFGFLGIILYKWRGAHSVRESLRAKLRKLPALPTPVNTSVHFQMMESGPPQIYLRPQPRPTSMPVALAQRPLPSCPTEQAQDPRNSWLYPAPTTAELEQLQHQRQVVQAEIHPQQYPPPGYRTSESSFVTEVLGAGQQTCFAPAPPRSEPEGRMQAATSGPTPSPRTCEEAQQNQTSPTMETPTVETRLYKGPYAAAGLSLHKELQEAVRRESLVQS